MKSTFTSLMAVLVMALQTLANQSTGESCVTNLCKYVGQSINVQGYCDCMNEYQGGYVDCYASCDQDNINSGDGPCCTTQCPC
ncbi:hypothetical protein BST61_g1484 [Cercospora zeina]